jgi:integrase
MPTNKLKDQQCKGAKPANGRAVKLFDGGGLFLYVTAAGAKVWRVAYRLGGKPKTKSLGAYPMVSLADARVALAKLKATLQAGGDPMQEREKSENAVTFAQACTAYWNGRDDVSDSYRSNALRGLEIHLYPALGKRGIGSITRDDLLAELRKMDAAGKRAHVRKVRIWAAQVFDHAMENGRASENPAAAIRPEKAFGRAQVENFAALALREVPEFMARLMMERNLNSVLACRMLALTWVRTSELRMMEWTEIENDIWIIPANKMKRRREHIVPLSRQALAVLEEMRARHEVGRFVFPAAHCSDRPMSENTILYLLVRIGYKGRMTGHGWRSIASTWANEAGYNPDAIERQLAHVPDNKIRAAYNRAEYLPLRRKMLQAWADWLLPKNHTPSIRIRQVRGKK